MAIMHNMANESHRYDDIIDLPHHQSATRPRMSLADRAVQFSPFAALVGYGASIDEAKRLTDRRILPDESKMDELNQRFCLLRENLSASPEVTITYFQPDERKTGGAYRSLTGQVKKLDEYARRIIFTDGSTIAIGEITALDGELFSAIENGFE